jgi:predicted transcriptional regulator YdeE
MTPRMTTCGTFSVLGVVSRISRGSESPELFGRIWKTFESRRREIDSVATRRLYFGVSFPTDDDGVTEYLAGMTVAAGTPPPDGLEARTISGGQYAVFECPVDAIGATYQHVFNVWLPNASVHFDAVRAPFEEYPSENTPDQPVRLHIPVRQEPRGGQRSG